MIGNCTYSSSSTIATTSSTSLPSTSPTSTIPSNTTPPSSTGTGSKSTPLSGISSGAKAGIGIGFAVGVIGIAGAVAWLFWRKRSAARKSYGWPGMSELEDDLGKHELAAPHGQQELEVRTDKPRIYEMAAQP